MRETVNRLSVAVLAGGKGSRFGGDKSGIRLQGKRVLEDLVEKLRAFPFERIVLVRARGQAVAVPHGIVALEDDREGLGPLGGILTALRYLPGDVLVAACDMPLVSRAMIQWLLEMYRPGVDAVIPRHAGGVEPLLGIYAKSIVPAMEAAVRAECYALHYLLEEANTRFVEVPDGFSPADEFANINTPEDYKRIAAVAAARTAHEKKGGSGATSN